MSLVNNDTLASTSVRTDKEQINSMKSIIESTLPTTQIEIIGIPLIDNIIIDICPEIKIFSSEEITSISKIIKDHIFGHQYAGNIIESKTNIEIAEYIEEIAIIVATNDIETIDGIQKYFEKFSSTIDTSPVCKG